jgi:heme exporter protein C
MTQTRPRLLTGLTVAAVVMFVVALVMGLFVAPTDQQGHVQRIFYFHLGAYISAALSFLIAAVASVLYLVQRDRQWDTLALSAIEVGLVLGGFNLVSGMIWARPIWNTWWTWDPRLTAAAVSWLAYAAYLMLRNGIEDPDRRARFASVYGILAFSSVIFTMIITRIRPDTIHPVVVGPSPQNAQGGFNVEGGAMTMTLMFNMLTFVVIAVTLIWHRVRLENLGQRVAALKMKALSR